MNLERPTSTVSARSGLSADRPFPGLRPYYPEDHEFFFGREDQIYALYRLFDHSRFVAVVGSSGSGKSSLVRAGLLPLLEKESNEPTGRVWKRIQMHPGDTPIGNLAAAMVRTYFPQEDATIAAARQERIKFALRRSSFGMSDALHEIEGLGDTSIILVVDQFEELFRYASRRHGADDEIEAQRHEEAAQFVQVLLAASRDRGLNVYVMLTMRSDFIGDCANFHGLAEAVSTSQFLVPSLTRDQREEAIRRPIEIAGTAIEPELVEQLLNDSGDDIDNLPVLQHCLLRVWEAARLPGGGRRHLTMQNYLDVGGMNTALSKHADEILQSLRGAGLAVEQTFRSLAEIDLEGRVVRRARLFKNLLAETGVPERDLRTVVDRFRDDDCSFLTPPRTEVPALAEDTRVDVGHEALLRRWERVSGDPRTGSAYTGWLPAEVADGRAYRGLLWRAESKDDTLPINTVEAQWKWWNERPRTVAWAERYGGRIEEVECLFKNSLAALDVAKAREAAARAAERRLTRLAWATAAVVSGLLLVAIGLSVFSYWQWQNAVQQTSHAQQAKALAERQTSLAQRAKALAEEQQANAESSLALSINLVTQLVQQIRTLLDNGQISVGAARKFLTITDATSKRFAAADQPPALMESEVKLLVGFADLYGSMQDFKVSLQSARQAQAIGTEVVKANAANADYQDGLYSADFSAGDAESELYLIDDSMKDYNLALAITQSMARADPTKYRWLQYQAFILNKIADTDLLLHQPGKAMDTYNQALALNQTLASNNPNDASLQRDLATSLARVADAESSSNAADALAKLNTALTIRATLANTPPVDRSLQSNVAATYNLIANIYMQKSDYANAAAQYNLALQIRHSLANTDLTNNMWQSDLAYEYVYLGDLAMAQGKFPDAATNYQRSLTIRQALVDYDSGNFVWLKYLADSYDKLAGAVFAQNNLAAALTDRNYALPPRKIIGTQYPDVATRQRELVDEYAAIGDILVKQSNSKDAARNYQSALDTIAAFATAHPGNTSLNALQATISQKLQSAHAPAPSGH